MAKVLSCGVEFMRGILLFLNILFVIIGIGLIGIGIYIKVDNNFASILNDIAKSSTFDAQSLGFLAYMMIGAGVVTLLIALFGCVGEFLSLHLNNVENVVSTRNSVAQSMLAVHVCCHSYYSDDC